ncbi:hypothetical protein GIB67_005285, partial [Kingdonia uniflora]
GGGVCMMRSTWRDEQHPSFIHFIVRFFEKTHSGLTSSTSILHGMTLGRPIFVPVQDLEMGFEKIVRIAHARGVCKQQDAISKLRIEREHSVQGMDVFLRVLTSIPGIDNHDANALSFLFLSQAIGSIEAISRASKEHILEKTDLSGEKAEIITIFQRPGVLSRPQNY